MQRTHRKHVIVIGMVDSVHLARWLESVLTDSISLSVYPSGPHRRIHPGLERLITAQRVIYLGPSSPVQIGRFVFSKILRRHFLAADLARILTRNRFELVHAIEARYSGVLLRDALEIANLLATKNYSRVLLTSYGSEINWFAKQGAKWRTLIAQVIRISDVLITECDRDALEAKRMGYQGQVSSFPQTGGVDPDESGKGLLPPNQRKQILIKGYQGRFGRLSYSLRLLRRLRREFHLQLPIHIYSAGLASIPTILKHRVLTRGPVRVSWKHRLSHPQMLAEFSRSRFYIGSSTTDGISTSLLEAMSQGAIPIQTNTACTQEWFSSGVSGVAADLNDLERTVEEFRRLISHKDGMERAQEINLQKIRKDYSKPKMRRKAKELYLAR